MVDFMRECEKMGYPRLEVDESREIVRTVYQGVTTELDLRHGNSSVMGAVEKFGPCSGITDFTAVTKFDVSSAEMRGLAKLIPAIPPERKKVVVAPRDVAFGMSRAFQMLTEEFRPNLRVVRSMAEAYELLGVTSPQFHPLY